MDCLTNVLVEVFLSVKQNAIWRVAWPQHCYTAVGQKFCPLKNFALFFNLIFMILPLVANPTANPKGAKTATRPEIEKTSELL